MFAILFVNIYAFSGRQIHFTFLLKLAPLSDSVLCMITPMLFDQNGFHFSSVIWCPRVVTIEAPFGDLALYIEVTEDQI